MVQDSVKILLVEDSSSMKDWISKNIFLLEGAELIGCSATVESALQNVETQRPDIVILDIRLKDGTGTKVLSFIKSNFSTTKVIVFSNYQTFKSQCDELGSDYFFDKAFDYSKLISTIENLIAERNMQSMRQESG